MKTFMRRIYLVIGIFCFLSMVVSAQERQTPRISIVYNKVPMGGSYVGVKVRVKQGKKFSPIGEVAVEIFQGTQQMGQVTTDRKGEAQWAILPGLQAVLDTMETFSWSAKVAEDKNYESAEEEITVRASRLRIEAGEGENRQINVQIEKKENGSWMPAKGVEMKIFVKRQFGRLPLGDDTYTSDEEGKIQTTFEMKGIPGDATGKITVGCIIEENEELGTVLAFKEVGWGIPFVAKHDEFNDRTLWATRDKTPMWLLIFPNMVIVVVWGLMVYLILQIIRIRKIGIESKQ